MAKEQNVERALRIRINQDGDVLVVRPYSVRFNDLTLPFFLYDVETRRPYPLPDSYPNYIKSFDTIVPEEIDAEIQKLFNTDKE